MVVSEPVAVAVAVLAVGIAIWTASIPLTRRTVLAAAPWTIAAAAVTVAARAGAYDAVPADLSLVVLLSAVVVLSVVAWVGCAELAALRDVRYRDRYLAVSGAAAAFILLGALFVYVGDLEPLRLVWLVIAPVSAGAIAAVGFFLVGIVYTDALSELKLTGLYAATVVVLDGTASVSGSYLGGTERSVVTAGLQAVFGFAGLEASELALLPTHLAVAISVVAFCGWLSRTRGTLGVGLLLAVTTGVLASATVVLLSAVLLG